MFPKAQCGAGYKGLVHAMAWCLILRQAITSTNNILWRLMESLVIGDLGLFSLVWIALAISPKTSFSYPGVPVLSITVYFDVNLSHGWQQNTF